MARRYTEPLGEVLAALVGVMKTRRIVTVTCALVVVASLLVPPIATAQTPQRVPQQQQTTGVTLYPILAAVPIFGVTVDIPPSEGGGSGASGSTDVSLNGAYGFGVIVEGRRWLLDANGLWAAVGARRATPFTTVDSDVTFSNAMIGVRVARGLFAIGGIRRIGADLDVTLTPVVQPTEQPSTMNGHASTSAWDPMVGVNYHGRLNNQIRFDLVFKGGGFGVGTDIDLSAEAAFDWDITRHFVLRAGYSFTYYKWTIDAAEVDGLTRTLVSKQTLHGPEIGLGIRF